MEAQMVNFWCVCVCVCVCVFCCDVGCRERWFPQCLHRGRTACVPRGDAFGDEEEEGEEAKGGAEKGLPLPLMVGLVSDTLVQSVSTPAP